MKPIATVNPSMFKSFEYRIQKNTGSADFWEVTPSVANGIKVVSYWNWTNRFNRI